MNQIKTFLVAGMVAFTGGSDIASAQPADFSMCDGQSGVALGLCHGGVAAGCSASDGGTEACLAIEQKYRTVTGGDEAPWISIRYPVNTLRLDIWVGADLESGSVGYFLGVKVLDPSFPYCEEINSCDVIDLLPDLWEEAAGDSGNPFLFWQVSCTNPSEPGYGGVPEYVVLHDVPFGDVTGSDIDSLAFVTATFEPAYGRAIAELPHLRHSDTLVVHTCAGNYFKVGNQTCNYPGSSFPVCQDTNLPEYWTQVDYQMLRQAP